MDKPARKTTRSKRGVVLSIILVVIASYTYFQKFYQIDNWQVFFFQGTQSIRDSCGISFKELKGGDFQHPSQILDSKFTPIRVPHLGEKFRNLWPNTESNKIAVYYRCRFSISNQRNDGIYYAHLGFLYNEKADIYLNGTKRTSLSGKEKPVIPFTENDLAKKFVNIDIALAADKTTRFGLVGGQHPVVASGRAVNNRVFGLSFALYKVGPLYNLLPLLFLGLVCVFGIFMGFQSRLIITALFFTICASIRSFVLLFGDQFPLLAPHTAYLWELLSSLSALAFLVFAMEQLDVWSKKIYLCMNIVPVLVIFEIAFFYWWGDNQILYTGLQPFFAVAIFLGGILIATLGYRNTAALADSSRRKVNLLFITFLLLVSSLPLLEVILNLLSIYISPYQYIDVFLPLFLGGFLFKTLTLIQRQLAKEKDRRSKMEQELNIAAKLQNALLPKQMTGKRGISNTRLSQSQMQSYVVIGQRSIFRRKELYTC